MINFFFPPATEKTAETMASEMITQSMMNTTSYVEIFRGDENTRKEPMEFVFRKNLLMIKEHSSEFIHYHYSEDGSKLECFFMMVPNYCAQSSTYEKVFKGGVFEFVLRFGLAPIQRLIKLSDFMDAVHDEVMQGRPRYYCLQRMVVEKTLQGKGIGSKYLGNALKKADEEQVPVVLGTEDPKNVIFYGRL